MTVSFRALKEAGSGFVRQFDQRQASGKITSQKAENEIKGGTRWSISQIARTGGSKNRHWVSVKVLLYGTENCGIS
jgi:hypothetical protein